MEGNKLLKKTCLTIILITLMIIISLINTSLVISQEKTESAEIIAFINDPSIELPSIEVSEWTTINITVIDAFGINWSKLHEEFKFLTTYVWPIIRPDWKRFLGYSSLRFEPEIFEGNPKGWYTKITNNSIIEAGPGRRYNLKLEIKTDDSLVDYSVVIGIKTTRLDIYGEFYGESYIYIPIKAKYLKNIKMEASKIKEDTKPVSHVHFNISLKNYGYYEEIYKLDLETENDIIASASKQIFVIKPGDTEDIRIEVLTPEKIVDFGTANRIKIFATPSGSNTTVLVGTLIVFTKGVFIPPFLLIIIFILTLFFLLLYLLFIKIRKNK